MKQMLIYLILMPLIFLGSRVYFFDLEILTESIYNHWQILDIEELKSNLFQSLYYQHNQPPFFNFLVGVLAKISQTNFPYILAGLYLLMSFGIYWMLFRILIYLNLSHILAFLAATLYILTPEAILYERWMFYTWLIAFLIVLSVYLLVKYTENKNKYLLLGFFTVIAIVMLTRSMFHLIYLPGVILLVYWIDRKSLRQILLMSLIPLLSVSAVYMKNYSEFGFFGGSSWLGMNISKVAAHSLLDHSFKELSSLNYTQKKKDMQQHLNAVHARGEISEVTKIGGFMPILEYPAQYREPLPDKYANIKVLSESTKSSGYTNMNHFHYLKISKVMQQDALMIIRTHLTGYFRTVGMALRNYMKPSWDYPFVIANAEKMKGYIKLYELNYLGGKLNNSYGLIALMILPVMLLLSMIYTLVSLVKQTKEQKFIVLFMLYTVLYVMLLGIMLEIGELHRMRVMTDPIMFVLSIAALNYFAKSVFWRQQTI